MTAHELAKKLMEMPDVEVIGADVGQGSHEGGNETLVDIELRTVFYESAIYLRFY